MEGKHRDRVDLAKFTEQARLHPHWYLSREFQSGKHHAGLSPQQSEDSIRPLGHKKASLHRMYNKCAKDLDPVSCQKAEKLMHVTLFDFSKNTFFKKMSPLLRIILDAQKVADNTEFSHTPHPFCLNVNIYDLTF